MPCAMCRVRAVCALCFRTDFRNTNGYPLHAEAEPALCLFLLSSARASLGGQKIVHALLSWRELISRQNPLFCVLKLTWACMLMLSANSLSFSRTTFWIRFWPAEIFPTNYNNTTKTPPKIRTPPNVSGKSYMVTLRTLRVTSEL